MTNQITDSLMHPNLHQQCQDTNHLINERTLSNHTAEQSNFVEFSMYDLAVITGGNSTGNPEDKYEASGVRLNHNETIISSTNTTQAKSPAIVLLNLDALAAISGGNGEGKSEDEYGDDALSANHNETMVSSEIKRH
ncbi:hypothetical protein [Leptothoe spongobia]|uniref:Uncharacterized protein n=1 Tax=Leptothoe spongobia TAU-MAC 1115 TaxID=1967444 RepID=A0A947DF80_9CYAN|nr:hypothetical protein [Leptothoe spongobia]MBT9315781.1 hypothetical protein [Leptothoe spongobia TAU-MAC 1115]